MHCPAHSINVIEETRVLGCNSQLVCLVLSETHVFVQLRALRGEARIRPRSGDGDRLRARITIIRVRIKFEREWETVYLALTFA